VASGDPDIPISDRSQDGYIRSTYLYLAQRLLTMSLMLALPLCVPEHTRMVSHRDVGPGYVVKNLIMTSPRDSISVNTRTS